ncbi:RNA 3'-terminal phosphate cyclase [Duganella radicis]|uniref:RNA 3'-terminal phosphate cyclase n=1 Tax=Duganella radicis TaxID=551988 RepID=A0A6L6PIT2_9BURK|nr:RNA 3'-terminal phosphate cyclase [Duganella radicis]MTV38950.1 RNA 3'-terminal phosphate cyclase [Duganella radicis]
MIELDGAQGEGGGQVLRSALTLSMITGQPFRMKNIRANRPKPGLMRQHLIAVQASAAVCGANVSGAQVGSQTLDFAPGPIRGGDYAFAIGTAGSCTLVLQTLLPALLAADQPSAVKISGGTHNAKAPPVQSLQRAYGRVLQQMGAEIDIELKRFGFYPAGGGEVLATVRPCPQLRPFELVQRGARRHGYAESFIAGVPANVATRELAVIGAGMGWTEEQLLHRGLPGEQGPGNALLLTLEHEHVTEVFTGFGEKSLRAETVAKQVLQETRAYLASGAAVGEHLADQLMLPMALAGGGSFTTNVLSSHAVTNADVISHFLPVRFHFGQSPDKVFCQLKTA